MAAISLLQMPLRRWCYLLCAAGGLSVVAGCNQAITLGTVGGVVYTSSDTAILVKAATPTSGGTMSVNLVSDGDGCGDLFAPRAGMTRVTLQIFSPVGTSIGPGAYPVTDGSVPDGGTVDYSAVYIHALDADSKEVAGNAPFSGEVTLTQVTPTVDGMFDVKTTGGSLAGSFSADPCQPPDNATTAACY